MKFISVELASSKDDTCASVALFEQRKGTFFLVSAFDASLDELEGLKNKEKLYVLSSSSLFAAETITVPSALNGSSLELFLKSKLLKDREKSTLINKKYKLDDKNEASCFVALMPDKVFEKTEQLSDKLKSSIDVFTSSSISLFGISEKIFPKQMVLHAFGDNEKLIFTVSCGSKLYYSRTAINTEGIELAAELEMTLAYVRKSKNINPEVALFSGLYASSKSAFELMENKKEIKPVVLTPEGLLNDCDFGKFHELIIPFGAVLSGANFNFIPKEFKQKKFFNSSIFMLNIMLIGLLVVLSVINIGLFTAYKKNFEKLSKTTLDVRIDREKTATLLEKRASGVYLATYLELINKRNQNPIRNFNNISSLAKKADFDRVIISRTEQTVIVAAKRFKSVGELTDYEKQLKDEIVLLKDKGLNVKDESKLSYETLSANIKILADGKSR